MATANVLEELVTSNQRDLERTETDFATVAQAHRSQIFRFLLASMRDPDMAETLTQDCLLKAYRNWASFRGESSVMTWLLRIAINLQKDYWRNRRLQFWRQTQMQSVSVDEASEWLPSQASSPEAQLMAREQVQQVWRVVETLSERQKTIFLLRHVEEMDLLEIAETTGLNEGTVKAHLSRAMAKVRAEMRKSQ